MWLDVGLRDASSLGGGGGVFIFFPFLGGCLGCFLGLFCCFEGFSGCFRVAFAT